MLPTLVLSPFNHNIIMTKIYIKNCMYFPNMTISTTVQNNDLEGVLKMQTIYFIDACNKASKENCVTFLSNINLILG